MENKYYTPSIEEFHVGFEYETKISSNHDEWMAIKIISPNQSLSLCGTYRDDWELELVRVDETRVKYLDKEDIEELGFVKRTKDEWIGWRDYSLGAISGKIGYFLKATLHKPRMDDIYKIYLHRYLDDDTKIEPKVNEGESELVYKGKIKNKSELKFILTMVNIF